VWQAIERRIGAAAPRRGPAWRRSAGLAVAVAALAAGLLLTVQVGERGVRLAPELPTVAKKVELPAPPAATRLERAFADTDRAIATLESDYAARRPSPATEHARRQAASLARLRHDAEQVRLATADDPRGRRAAFRAYMGYSRSLRAALLEETP